jgi:chemotaxis protein methyltransferase CheR
MSIEIDIEKAINIINGTNGFDVSKYDETFLFKILEKRIIETSCGSSKEYCSLLENDAEETIRFLDSLFICYTEFFRNSLTFSVLEHLILPSFILNKKNDNKNKEIRIWSAACAGGQEAYSLAMLLEEFNNNNAELINYRIFATDQSEEQRKLASKGQYDELAINNLISKRIKQWFTKRNDYYYIKPLLKKNIEFSVFDLFDEHLSCPQSSIFGDFDIVICANLLFYYKREYQETILNKIVGCITERGYIICGETERGILMNYGLKEFYPYSGIFRKK